MGPLLQVTVPELGQFVDARRRYVVIDVAQSPLPPDVLTAGGLQRQHLVTLSSIDGSFCSRLSDSNAHQAQVERQEQLSHATPYPDLTSQTHSLFFDHHWPYP